MEDTLPSACDVSSAPVLALETQLPTGCPSQENRRYACPCQALEAQGEVWRYRRSAGPSVKRQISTFAGPLLRSEVEHGGKQMTKVANVVELDVFVTKLLDVGLKLFQGAHSWLKRVGVAEDSSYAAHKQRRLHVVQLVALTIELGGEAAIFAQDTVRSLGKREISLQGCPDVVFFAGNVPPSSADHNSLLSFIVW